MEQKQDQPTDSQNSFRQTGWVSFRFKIGNDQDLINYFQSENSPILGYRFFEYEYVKDEVVKKKKIWPGNVFVQIKLETGKSPFDTIDFIRHTPYFLRFHSYVKNWKADPMLFSNRYIERIGKQIEERWNRETKKIDPKEINLKLNDIVSILDGVFRGYEGEVIGIDYETGTITLNVEFFGRITPVKVAFNECKKIR